MVHFNKKTREDITIYIYICLYKHFLFVKLLDVCRATAALLASADHVSRLIVRPLISMLWCTAVLIYLFCFIWFGPDFIL